MRRDYNSTTRFRQKDMRRLSLYFGGLLQLHCTRRALHYWDCFSSSSEKGSSPRVAPEEKKMPTETLRGKMAGVAPAQLPTIKQAVADAARRYFESGTMSFPAEALIVSGKKSAG